MNITFIIRYFEALLFICAGILYGLINTWLMLITWLHRFSGNANFLLFQIIALDGFVLAIFLQAFKGMDKKRRKYARELLNEEGKQKTKLI